MEVYVECVIVDNILIDYFILSITKRITRLKTSNKRLWIVSAFGACVSLICPLVSGFWLVLVKILCAIIMPMLILQKGRLKKYMIVFLSFLLSTMIMIGACIMLCSMFKIEYTAQHGTICAYNFPIGLILLICLIMYLIVKNLINQFYSQKRTEKFLYNVTINYLGKQTTCTAFLDSGNRLAENNKPIILINMDTLTKLCDVKLSDIILKKVDKINLKNIHQIDINSVATSSKLLVFEIDNIIIDNKNFSNILAGISLNTFANLDVGCILSPLMFE